VLTGGAPQPGTQFFPPTVLVDVRHGMEIIERETFGPVMCVVRVRDEAEAVKLANDSEFGLSSSVFTRDPARGERIAKQLVAGSTVVNDFGLHYMAQDLPFGGVKASGFGRLNGREGLRACCNVKAMIADRVPVHRAAKLFPVKPGDYELTRELIRTVYRSGGDRVRDAMALGRRAWQRLRERA
jgi:acyl-CoA reductase-like NAD-dependent aldehyde dehydrogenase